MIRLTPRSLSLTLVLGGLFGCAAPNPYYGNPAPVVDRSSIYNQQAVVQPAPIEVAPLERRNPFVSENRTEQYIVREQAPLATLPAPVVQPKPQPQPQPQVSKSNDAVMALLESAATHVETGNLDKAASDLERALRIESKDPAIWHDLGQIRLGQGQLNQAEAMFEKSNSLAGGLDHLRARNWRKLAEIRRRQGESAAADAADAKATLLENK